MNDCLFCKIIQGEIPCAKVYETDRILAFCSDNQDGGGIDLEWVRKNTVIIHYCGRNKPWKKNYIGQLGVFYQQYRAELEQFRQSRPDGWTQ